MKRENSKREVDIPDLMRRREEEPGDDFEYYDEEDELDECDEAYVRAERAYRAYKDAEREEAYRCGYRDAFRDQYQDRYGNRFVNEDDDFYDEGGCDGFKDDYDDYEGFDAGPGSGGKGHKKRNGGGSGKGIYLFISLAVGLLFLLLMVNLVHFQVKEKDEVLNSPYNKRNNSQADYVVRGEIRSVDGATLAKTRVYDDGSEERVYPYFNLYAHVVGFLSHGKSGLESACNYELLNAHNNIIDQIINSFTKAKNPGDTVVTTLISRVQEAAYDAMDNYRGAIVAMNPQTGAIYAMVAQPHFDPNVIDEIWDDMVSDSSNSQLLNRATQGKYPPGSTFKIVTALAYYREHGTFDRFSFDCEGQIEVGNSTVHCYNNNIHGTETFYDAFAHSCNTAFAKIGLELGAGSLSTTARSLLFGKSLPCDVLASVPRWNLTLQSTREELVQTAFGQGKTLTTPYHMACIVSAIANDGVLKSPYLVDHIENNVGNLVETTKAAKEQRLMTSKEAGVLSELMRDVVEYGTASRLNNHNYKVYGKTGSAEYLKSDGTMGTHSWFVGFSGYEDPDLVVAVLAENGGAGSSTAVPMAEKVFRAYYGE